MAHLQKLRQSLAFDLLDAARVGELEKALTPALHADAAAPWSAKADGEHESISTPSRCCMSQSCTSTLSSRRGIAVSLESPDTSPERRRLFSQRIPGHFSPPGSFPDSVSSRLTTGTQAQYAEPWQTIIFLDFDDTLFPTTWLGSIGLLPIVHAPTDPEILTELERMDEAACGVLAAACQLSSRTCIVTNARAGWVLDSAQTFMPRLHSLLHSPSAPGIVYARDKLQQRCRIGSVTEPADRTNRMDYSKLDEFKEIMTQAKTVAMEGEVKAFYSQYPKQSWKNLISIGDGSYEHDAIQEITFVHAQPLHKKLRTKAIKLSDTPNCSELERQLQTLKTYLSTIVQFNGDLDVEFGRHGDEKGLAEALQLPVSPMNCSSPQRLPQEFSIAELRQINEFKI